MNHNKVANFMSANGSGDHKMKRDILLSEIAKIIVGHPKLVVFHLRESGFKIENNPSKSTLVTTVSNALNKSKKFATKMANEILGSNYGATGTIVSATDTTMPVSQDVATASPVSAAPVSSTSTVSAQPSPTQVVSETIAIPTPTPTRRVDPVAGATTTIAEVKPAPAAPQVLVLPIVSGLGSVFGGSERVMGGGGGGGGGGGSAPEQATADLQAKTNALTDVDGSIRRRKKILGFSFLFIVIAGSTYYYYTHNK